MPSGVTEEVRVEAASSESKTEGPSKDTQQEEKKVETVTDSNGPASASGATAGEEGVEVVLEQGTTKVVEGPPKSRPPANQNVFRHPQAVRPRVMRGGHPPPPPGYLHGSGSWGYPHYPPPHHHHPDYPPPPRPYPVPPYGSSGSFEEQAQYHHHTPHYSPHVQYPHPGGRYDQEVNVISPNHKTGPPYRPALTPRPRQMHPHAYYQYPPTSPVSRPGSSDARPRSYDKRRDGPYAKAQRPEQHPDDGTWNSFPSRSASGDMTRRQPPLVTESSFDSHPPTPSGPAMPPPPPPSDPNYQFYGGGSWGSFDSGPPSHFDVYSQPPESPYSPYMPPYSPGGIYHADSFPAYGPTGSFSYSYDEEERLLKDYHPDRDGDDSKRVTPSSSSKKKKAAAAAAANDRLLPKAAEEVDFDVADPPAEPVTPPSTEPVCESLAEVNGYDVICGRGGGTNSQIGNRRFRKLVQEFQPTYLLARRKEKPLLARTIVLIIRKRGGRFLKKEDDSSELYEVGDAKAEAKTSQALREGLDVRATKSAASSLLEKKKKKKSGPGSPSSTSATSPASTPGRARKAETSPAKERSSSPPSLPRLAVEDTKPLPYPPPPSPGSIHARKRRRMRSVGGSGGFTADRFFPDFCPPRADLGRPASPTANESMHMSTTPLRRNKSRDDDIRYDDDDGIQAQGCTGIALDMMTGAATSSFCLGPSGWRR